MTVFFYGFFAFSGALLGHAVSLIALKKNKVSRNIFILIALRTIIVATCASVIPDKLAVTEFERSLASGVTHNFFIYGFLGYPAYLISSSWRVAAIFVSAIFFGFYILPLSHLLSKIFAARAVKFVMAGIYFCPPMLVFSSVSMRDSAIALATLYICAGLTAWSLRAVQRVDIQGFILISVFLLSLLRAEALLGVLLVLFFAVLTRKFSVVSAIGIAVCVIVLLFILSTPVIKGVSWVGFSVNGDTALQVVRAASDARFDRQFKDSDGSGSTSSIMPASEWANTTTPVLMAKQSISVFYPVFSEGLSKAAMFAALTDIFIFMFFLIGAHLRSLAHKGVIIRLAAMLLFSVSVYFPVLVNFGNIYRMRLPLVLIFYAVAFYAVFRLFRIRLG